VGGKEVKEGRKSIRQAEKEQILNLAVRKSQHRPAKSGGDFQRNQRSRNSAKVDIEEKTKKVGGKRERSKEEGEEGTAVNVLRRK